MTDALYKLCLCMIVRNEAHVIERCLNSVKDVIDYWIICDTGSTDSTIQLIHETLATIPGELHEHKWENFAANRNRYLDIARKRAEYVFVMDADQVLEKRGFQQSKLKHDVYHCIVRYPGMEHRFPKVFRPSSGRYKGVLHEYVDIQGTTSNLDSLVFVDLNDGHRSKNRLEKSQRDIAILNEAVQGTEDVPRYTYYLGQTYREAEEYEKAISCYLRRTQLEGWEEEVWSSLYNVGRCFQALDRFDEALSFYLRAFDYRPTRAEPLYRAAEYARTQQRFHSGMMLLKAALDIAYPAQDILFIETSVYDYLRHFEYVILAYWTGDYPGALRMANYVESLPNVPKNCREQNTVNRQYALDRAAHLRSLSDAAHQWIRKNIARGSTILGLGSGIGSMKLAKDYTVFSVENNEDWLNLSDAVEYIHAPIRNNWYDRKTLKTSLPDKYDLLIVDGPPWPLRGKFLDHLDLFNASCPILIDDVNRNSELTLLKKVAQKFGRDYQVIRDKDKSFGIVPNL